MLSNDTMMDTNDMELLCLSDDDSSVLLAPFDDVVSIALSDDDNDNKDNWDQVTAFLRDVDRLHPSAVPDFACVHTTDRMFDLRNYRACLDSDLVDDFESWREIYNHCLFAPFLKPQKDRILGRANFLNVIHEGVPGEYFCAHSDSNRYAYRRCRTRPACCDESHRSFCWLDINISFHRAFRTNSRMPICIDAPIKSFGVDHPLDHPAFRIKEFFHSGSSKCSSEFTRARIDSDACKEITTGANLLRKLLFCPSLWSHAFDYLNLNERMVFASMMFDNDDDLRHDMRCMRMYGFNATRHRYSLYAGRDELPMNNLESLQNAMRSRRLSPCQQLMKYAGEYDIMNTINRHAARHDVLHDWESAFHRLVHAIGAEMNMDLTFYDFLQNFDNNLGQDVLIRQHENRHKIYFDCISDIHHFLVVASQNPSPIEFLSLLDYIVGKYNKNGSISNGDTIAHILFNLLADDCPTRYDFRCFLDAFNWDFSSWDGYPTASSVVIFLFQIFNVSIIDIAYLEHLCLNALHVALSESSLCRCDKDIIETTTAKLREVLAFCNSPFEY